MNTPGSIIVSTVSQSDIIAGSVHRIADLTLDLVMMVTRHWVMTFTW